jgi:3-hydroxyisobutyrate dehydrogenase-like beta-hydroxyacid dehydrogenase
MSANLEHRAAVLGLGIVGSRAFARLVDAGWQVACWNRTPKGLPGEMATPEKAIAGAAVISIYLKDATAVREVVGKILPSLTADQIVLNHATLDLETTKWLAESLAARGCRFLDAPFTGSKMAAGNGQLVYYVGGDAKLAQTVDDYLAITSKSRLHCGEVGAATVIKLATNLISACTVQALAEALAITTRHGVDAERLAEAVSRNAGASVLTGTKLPSMIAADFDPHFSLSNMGKDTRYMLALAASAGVETPAITAVSKRLGELEAAGFGGLDYAAVAKPYLTDA